MSLSFISSTVITLLTVSLGVFASIYVSWARQKYGIKAPKTSGHDAFEQIYRAHLNLIENTVLFLPILWLSNYFVEPAFIWLFGMLWFIGRTVFTYAYYINNSKLKLYASSVAMTALVTLIVLCAVRLILIYFPM